MSTKPRDLRRRLAFVHAKQRQRLHLASTNQAPDCICERSPFYFSKRRAFGCNCRKRKHGQPRLGTGDKFDARKEIYARRRATREVLGAVLSGRYHAEDDVVCSFRLR